MSRVVTTSTASRALEDFDRIMGWSLGSEPAAVKVRRRYFMGDQVSQGDLPDDVANALTPILTTPINRAFGVNLCARFVHSLTGILNIDGVGPGDESLSDSDAAQWVWDRCEASDWPLLVNRICTLAAVDGVGYVVMDFDAQGQPAAYVNGAQADVGGEGIEPIDVDAEGKLTGAIKRYSITRYVDTRRGVFVRIFEWLLSQMGIGYARGAVQAQTDKVRIIYEPDRIRRFVAPANGVERPADPIRDGLEPETVWPYSRLPVIAFSSPEGAALDAVIPVQQSINHTWLSLQHMALVKGFPIPFLIDLSRIADDQAIGPASVIQLKSDANKTGAVTALPSTDLAPLIEKLHTEAEFAAFIFGFPVMQLPWKHTGTPPSGEALRTAMQPLLSKADLYRENLDPAFEDVYALMQEMGNRAVEPIVSEWREQDFADAASQAQRALALQTINADPETVFRAAGLDQEDVERSLGYAAEAEAAQAERVSAMLEQARAQTESVGVASVTMPGLNGEVVPDGIGR